jgi:hypothetical protein
MTSDSLLLPAFLDSGPGWLSHNNKSRRAPELRFGADSFQSKPGRPEACNQRTAYGADRPILRRSTNAEDCPNPAIAQPPPKRLSRREPATRVLCPSDERVCHYPPIKKSSTVIGVLKGCRAGSSPPIRAARRDHYQLLVRPAIGLHVARELALLRDWVGYPEKKPRRARTSRSEWRYHRPPPQCRENPPAPCH